MKPKSTRPDFDLTQIAPHAPAIGSLSPRLLSCCSTSELLHFYNEPFTSAGCASALRRATITIAKLRDELSGPTPLSPLQDELSPSEPSET